MRNRTLLISAIALALLDGIVPAYATDTAAPSHALHEISDAELGTMRGRFTIGNDTVAWFGVNMISTWQTPAGQTLQSSLALSMNFSTGKPTISFQPTVTITAANAPLPVTTMPAGPTRQIDSSGLANVGGLVQSVQVAGDGNLANNVTQLDVSNSAALPSGSGATTASGTPLATISSQDATATASYDGDTARVLVSIAGQGEVQQWISSGSLGQSVALTADNQTVSNQLQIELIRRLTAIGTSQLALNVAQAISLTHGIGNH